MDKAIQPHEQRVIDEYRELSERQAKLGNFFHTEIFLDLDQAEKDRLTIQVHAMTTYRECLRLRIVAMGHGRLASIDVEDITEADIEAVEDEIGMGRGAWDMVDHRELILACVKVVCDKRHRT